jgi:alpha-galactosidase
MKSAQSVLLSLTLWGCAPDHEDSALSFESSCEEDPELHIDWDGSRLHLQAEGCGSVALTPRVIGSGEWRVEMEPAAEGGWQPRIFATGPGQFEGLVLEGEWQLSGETAVALWRQGYQSWSWSGVTLPSQAVLDEYGVVQIGGDGDGTSVTYENGSTSWWVGLLGRADGASLLLGAQGATKTRFFVGVDDQKIQAVWGHRGEQIVVEDEASLTLDPLWLGMGSNPQALHLRYAEATTERIPARSLKTSPKTGWATWYQYYSEVTEEDVRRNLDALITLGADSELASVEVLQIDDGWQLRWGDWWAGEDFPSGMTSLASDISEAGMTPGLWLAPFYMSTESDTYVQNPDWWVRDHDGVPIQFSNLGTGDYVILDPTHPAAAEWLSETISGVVDQGYHYLKLDFLYAGAMEGQRREDVTGIEAFHVGMKIMREAAGDAWILACGAPLLPSLGYVESFRTGADIAFEVSTEPDIDYYRWQARATASRAWTQGRWWWMDPDQIILREPLSEVQVRGALASALVAGGTWMLGDDLGALNTDRLALSLHPELVLRLGQTVTPEAPLEWLSGVDPGPVIEEVFDDDHVPLRWELEDGTVVLLNLGLEAIEADGPGGTNLLTGESAESGPRVLQAGDGEVWIP